MKNIRIKNRKFIDNSGNEILLHGINLAHKNSEEPLPWTEEDFDNIRNMGHNCIRLVILWENVAPGPELYSDEYLDKVEEYVHMAQSRGIQIILDMHQDLYSYKVTNQFVQGADPEWFALTDGIKFETEGEVWSDAYLTSDVVKRMNDNFWNNKSVAGMGLQDHYAQCWKKIAQRFSDHPNVIGYNIMNEPNSGSLGEKMMLPVLIRAGVALFLFTGKLTCSADEIIALWLDKKSRIKIMKLFDRVPIFKWVIAGARRQLFKAEKKYLQPFYRVVSEAIRAVDSETMIMTEPFSSEFMGNRTSLKRTDSNEAYVPHIYDITVDTGAGYSTSNGRVASIFKVHNKDAVKNKMPIIIGEWGAYTEEGIPGSEAGMVDLFEKYLMSDTYWDYSAERAAGHLWFFPSICRPIVLKAAGTLLFMKTDEKSGLFRCSWIENTDMNPDDYSLLFIPGEFDAESIDREWTVEVVKHGYYLKVPSMGKNETRSLEIQFKR